MRKVVVAGVGMTNFGVFPDRRLEDLIHEAGKAALCEAGLWDERGAVEADENIAGRQRPVGRRSRLDGVDEHA